MFGLYELQPPAWMLQRLGGSMTASGASVFLSGLVVGVFAAPCIGPPIVALLALVAQKADPWFGLRTFFVLALGLGAPYLLLASSSGLLRRLPRSGEWMVWVKKVFGVILVAVGGFYLLLAVAPGAAIGIVPAALVLGGIYLGFLERSGRGKPTFRRLKWTLGGLAIAAGVVFVATLPREGVAFGPASAVELESARNAGTHVLLDFSAEWCVPCHELERLTFTDRRVIDAARGFRTLKVDLTHYDSPESETWRRHYQIRGVPTLVFLDAGGREVREARIEGFVPPDEMLRAMVRARGVAAAAEN
jgi:thiol:disulfide interchange protein DsbD